MKRLVPAALAATLGAALVAVGASSAGPPGNHYTVTPLASDVPSMAPVTDSNLQNTWGLARGPATPWWIANNGTASTSVYTGSGTRVDIGGLPAQGVPGDPTGAVFSGIAGQFEVGTAASPTTLDTSNFVFDSEDGTISAWRIGSTAAQVTVDMSSSGAVFKGLAISNGSSGPRLYATDFANGQVDVFNSSWGTGTASGGFADPNLPSGYAPFGIANIGGNLVVTFAKQEAGSADEQHHQGFGVVDMFDADGNLLSRIATHGQLNAPWGIAQAPSDFGPFSGDLLIGNFGDGQINAYMQTANGWERAGGLRDSSGRQISIEGLWGIGFGNDHASGSSKALYFAAGPNDENDGLFGSITAN